MTVAQAMSASRRARQPALSRASSRPSPPVTLRKTRNALASLAVPLFSSHQFARMSSPAQRAARRTVAACAASTHASKIHGAAQSAKKPAWQKR